MSARSASIFRRWRCSRGQSAISVSFGLQKIVSNLVSGIILLADKSIKPGDVISVGETYSWVETMSANALPGSVNACDFAWRCPNGHRFATAMPDIPLVTWRRLTERPYA